jgi:hypothetical protein
MLKIRRARLPGEPLGSVLERLIGLAEQKKVIAPIESYQPKTSLLDDRDAFNKIWEMADTKK